MTGFFEFSVFGELCYKRCVFSCVIFKILKAEPVVEF